MSIKIPPGSVFIYDGSSLTSPTMVTNHSNNPITLIASNSTVEIDYSQTFNEYFINGAGDIRILIKQLIKARPELLDTIYNTLGELKFDAVLKDVK